MRYRRVFVLIGMERGADYEWTGSEVLRVANEVELLKRIAHGREKNLPLKGWIGSDLKGWTNRISESEFEVFKFWKFIIDPVDFVEEERK